jgi:methylated-DNA-[protein]-cysteine S-methyltransferase
MRAAELDPVSFCTRAAPFGPVTVLWSCFRQKPAIRRILLCRRGTFSARAARLQPPDSRPASCSEINSLLDRIEAFLGGEDIRFSLDAVRLDLCSAFQEKVLRAEHAIPRGRVSTYRLIARRLGDANAARAVGTALATNPFPIVIPCHRAVRSDGALGDYQGGLKMKRALLQMEGIAFRDRDHVATRDFFYSA